MIIHLLRTIRGVWRNDRLVDPIEVFYLPDGKEVFPINSKAANSTVKLLLYQRVIPDFQARFPEIHRLDPAVITAGTMERRFFATKDAYSYFCAGKQVTLILRQPHDRFLSFANGIRSGKNVLYKDVLGDGRPAKLFRTLSTKALLIVAAYIPDRLADRHFRSQHFLVPDTTSSVVKLMTIAQFTAGSGGNHPSAIKLNKGNYGKSSVGVKWLQASPAFQRRYGKDIELFEAAEAGETGSTGG